MGTIYSEIDEKLAVRLHGRVSVTLAGEPGYDAEKNAESIDGLPAI